MLYAMLISLLLLSPDNEQTWQKKALPAQEVHELETLMTLLPDEMKDFPIESFQVSIKQPDEGGRIQIFENTGPSFSDALKEALSNCPKDTNIWFDNIRQKRGDGTTHVFNMAIKVT